MGCSGVNSNLESKTEIPDKVNTTAVITITSKYSGWVTSIGFLGYVYLHDIIKDLTKKKVKEKRSVKGKEKNRINDVSIQKELRWVHTL